MFFNYIIKKDFYNKMWFIINYINIYFFKIIKLFVNN